MNTKSLHILSPSFSTFARSVRLYCEELGLAYTIGINVDGEDVKFGSEQLAQYHPFKKVPALIHGDMVVFETTSICRYLDAAFPEKSLKPKSLKEVALVDEWSGALAAYVDQVLIRSYFLEFAFPKGPNKTVRDEVVNDAEPAVIDMLVLLDRQLGLNAFFCGDFYSMADAILTPMLDYLSGSPKASQLFATTEYLLPYLQRMKQRDSGKVVFK